MGRGWRDSEEEEAKRKTEGGYDGKEGKLGGGGRYLNGE